MFEQTFLREKVETLLVRTRQAAEGYDAVLGRFVGRPFCEDIEKLCRDKQRHVRLVESLLEVLD